MGTNSHQDTEEPSELRTNESFLQVLGLINQGGVFKRAFICIPVFFLISGGLQNLAKIFLEPEELNFLEKVENLHFVVLLLNGGFSCLALYAKTEEFFELKKMIRFRFNEHENILSEEQLSIRNRYNALITKVTKIHTTLCIIGTIGQFVRRPLTLGSKFSNKYKLFFNGYFPFDTKNLTGYLAAQLFQIAMGVFILIFMITIVVVFFSLSGHLIAQINILHLSLKYCLEPQKSSTQPMADEAKQIYKLINCVKHHIVIITYFKLFQKYFSIMLFNFSIGTGLMLCTVGFEITDPNGKLEDVMAFAIIFGTEIGIVFLYCFIGQTILDEHEKISNTMYQTPWYENSPKVRRIMLMMMIRSRIPLELTGAGLQSFTLKQFGEILTTSYSYFNVLRVMRKE